MTLDAHAHQSDADRGRTAAELKSGIQQRWAPKALATLPQGQNALPFWRGRFQLRGIQSFFQQAAPEATTGDHCQAARVCGRERPLVQGFEIQHSKTEL